MTPPIDIVPLQSDHRADVIRLLGIEGYKEDVWAWQFQRETDYCRHSLVALSEQRCVGFNGVMPVTLNQAGTSLPAAWSCDFVVDASCRGQGVGKLIKKALAAQQPRLMSLGISDMAVRVLEKSGWRSSLTPVTAYSMNRTRRDWKGLIIRGIQVFNRVRGRGWCYRTRVKQVEVVDQLPDSEALDRLWKSVKCDYPLCVARSAEYLQWRYRDHPSARYRYVCNVDDGVLQAMLVFRCEATYAVMVDYIGPAQGFSVKQALLDQWLNTCRDAPLLKTFTSDPEWGALLRAQGFRVYGQQRFYLSGDGLLDHEWFIMPGDSDGEFLEAARERHQPDVDQIVIERVSEAEFLTLQPRWHGLMNQAVADPLFNGWPWLWEWWQTWGEKKQLQLMLLAAYRGTQLVGVLPLYLQSNANLFGLRVKRVQLIGNIWPSTATVRTEFTDAVFAEKYSEVLSHILSRYLLEKGHWDEIVLADVASTSYFYPALAEQVRQHGGIVRVLAKDRSISIDCDRSYVDYLASRSANHRAQLRRKQKRLTQLGEYHLCGFSGSLPAFFQQLNQFHLQRWGIPCFDAAAVAFHIALATGFQAQGRLHLSELRQNKRCISVMYNVEINGKVYNMQSGFDTEIDARCSIGTLHLEAVVEQYCQSASVKEFDLLAGTGKKSFYKSHFSTHGSTVMSLQLVRAPLLRLGYWCYDHLPDRFKPRLYNLFMRRGAKQPLKPNEPQKL